MINKFMEKYGYIHIEEDRHGVRYLKYEPQGYNHIVSIHCKASGKHLMQSYDAEVKNGRNESAGVEIPVLLLMWIKAKWLGVKYGWTARPAASREEALNMCEAEFCCDEGAVLATLDYYDRHGYEPCTTQKSNSELSEKERLKQRICNQRKEIAALHKQLADAYASIELASDACKTIEARYKSQFAEKEIELQAMRNAANQYKRDFTCATKELNAALDDLSGFCWACAHGKPAKIRTGGLTTCDYMREQGTLARGGRCKCGYWQWRGPQKEDNENDD